MAPIEISWVYEPSDSPAFRLGNDPRFIDAVARSAGVNVVRLEGDLRDLAPARGFILLNSVRPHESIGACSSEDRDQLASRVVVIGMRASRLGRQVLSLGISAAVDDSSYLEWSEGSEGSVRTHGIVGLRAVAERMGVSWAPLDGRPDYGDIVSEVHRDLPHLLADYLLELHRTREPR